MATHCGTFLRCLPVPATAPERGELCAAGRTRSALRLRLGAADEIFSGKQPSRRPVRVTCRRKPHDSTALLAAAAGQYRRERGVPTGDRSPAVFVDVLI